MKIKLLILATLFLLTAKTASAATIKINEFYAAGSTTSNPDWVEIYYSGVDITLYQLRDAAGNTKNLSEGSYGGNFAIIDWSNRLNNDGDTIKLVLIINPDSPTDQVTYGGSGDISVPNSQQSAGRNTDGIGGWVLFSTPTKGYTNNVSLPTPTPSPTPTPPTPSSSPTPTSSSTPKPTSSFTISDLPPQINSDQSFEVSVNLTLPNNKNADYYLSGAFKKVDGTRYFGLTKINSEWIKYNSSNFLNQYKITTDNSGGWTGTLEVKPDTEDSDYKGSGDYIFKVARYLSNSTPTWSSESTIKIVSAENNQDEISANIPSPATTFLQVKTSAPSPTKNYERLVYRIASIAAATASAKTATSEASIKVKNQKQINPIIWIGLFFIFAGVGSIGYIYLKSNGKISFKFR